MLERIREGSQGIVAKVILGLVILTFAVSGIGSYINSKADTALATVNGVEITQTAVEEGYQQETNNMKSQYGEVVDQLLADENYVANLRQGVLDRLIVQELQRQQAKELGIRVSDDQIKQAILEMPNFQRDNKFDNEIYLAVLRQAGFQPSQFRDYIRQEMVRSQYNSAVMGSEFVLEHEKKGYSQLVNQVRTFDQLTVSASALTNQVVIEDADLNAFFEENKARFKTQEKVALEYIVIDADLLADSVVVTEDALKDYYDVNINDYTTPERRRISHILIELADDAQARIADIKNKLDAGERFETLAKTFSEDSFSAENGGDLEWFEPGLFGDAFDSAVEGLEKAGDVSGVFESENGFHIVQLTELQEKAVAEYADVRSDIEEQFKTSRVDELYYEAQTVVSQFAFEIPDTLEDAAKESGIALQETAKLTYAEVQSILNNAVATNKAFDEDFIAEGLNSDLIEIDDTRSVVLRVVEHEASRSQSLEEVKSIVESAVTREKAAELAESKAKELAEQLAAGENANTLAADAAVTIASFDEVGRFDSQVNAQIRDAVFALPKPLDGSAVVESVDLSTGDAVVVALKAVTEKEALVDEPMANQVLASVSRQATIALIEASKNNAEIEKP